MPLTRRAALAMPLALPAILAASCPGEELGHVPMVEADRAWLVPVRIGDRALSMILDTGAAETAIARAAARALALPVVAEAATGALSGTGRVPAVAVQSFSFAGIAFNGLTMPAVEADLPRFDPLPPVGLLGLAMLSPFDLALDFPGGLLGLHAHAACDDPRPPWRGAFSQAPIRAVTGNMDALVRNATIYKPYLYGIAGHVVRLTGAITLDVSVNDRPLRALLDTGAAQTVIAEAPAEALGLPRGAPIAHVDANGTRLPATRTRARVRVAEVGWNADDLAVAAPHLPYGCDMILGADLLRRCRVFLALSAGRMLLQPA